MELNKKNRVPLILTLGSMTALSPFSIDMYLSAFPQMAMAMNTTVSEISITLSSYFVGLASGQLFYGPLMDKFGRKKPLYFGILLYALASIGCALSTSVETLAVLRFIQAIGGCSASVGAFAIVRDLFSPQESAKVLSLLILILGVSPLFAPTIGGYVSHYFGWSSVFITLAIMSSTLLFFVYKILPESHKPDTTLKLHPVSIIKNYWSILKEPQFYTYALAGAIAFAGMFTYIAASPIIFMEIFKVSEQVYGWIFAIVAMGIVGSSQLNVFLLKRFSNQAILKSALTMLIVTSLVFVTCAYMGWYNVYSIVVIMFIFLACLGLSNPNSAALSMAKFGTKAGSAAALMGFLQMSIGASTSLAVGLLKAQELFPLSIIFIVTSTLALTILLFGTKKINQSLMSSGPLQA